jgi:mannose-6-phosphate isomerase-like protein (cupin superfamily)
MLRAVFGKAVDTYYFDEHYHIDAHHGRMAFDYVVAPAIARHGDSVIPDIVRGMEELQLLTAINDEDLMAQIAFADAAQPQNFEEVLQDPGTTHIGTRSQSLVTRVCDHDRLYVIESGSLELVIGADHSVLLESGQSIVVPRQRLHSTAVVSEECHYKTYDLN